jgi:hypothetical protein
MRTVFTILWVLGCGDSHRLMSDAAPAEVDGGRGRDGGLAPGEDGGPAGGDAGRVASDSGPIAVDAGPIDVDAGMTGVLGSIECGMLPCDATTYGCLASCLYATGERMPRCVALSEDGRWPARECPTGMEMFPRFWLTCDGSEDCAPGEICQLVRGSLGQYAYCEECPSCDFRLVEELCHDDADCARAAPRCLPTPELPGYSTCRPE